MFKVDMNGPQLPVTIHRSSVGLALIGLVGFGVTALLYAMAVYYRGQHWADPVIFQLITLAALVTLIATVVTAATYALTSLKLTDDHIEVSNWLSLFSSRVSQADYADIEDVTVTQGTILSRVFGYGTLLVQTAGTQTNLEITYVPNVYAWRDVIAGKARGAQRLAAASDVERYDE